MKRPNKEIKDYAAAKKVFLWEVAARFGITDSHFSRRLRAEFTPEEKQQAMQYIDEIASGRTAGKE